MNKVICIIVINCIFCIQGQAQEKGSFSIEANYGLQANFFVNSYNENNPFEASFFNKNVIGSIGGLAIKYNFNKKSALIIAYDQSNNTKEINYNENINQVDYLIKNWNIRHTNHFYQLGYEQTIPTKKSKWILAAGIVYVRMQQQEINISEYPRGIYLRERNFKSNGLEEGGIYAGIQHSWLIDTHFELGIRTRIFYLASVNTLESITLTPVLTYHFIKMK